MSDNGLYLNFWNNSIMKLLLLFKNLAETTSSTIDKSEKETKSDVSISSSKYRKKDF